MRPRDLAGPFGVPGAFDTAGGAIPKGVICLWSGRLDEMPPGWALCDGANGTPNLVARFVRGISTATTNPGTTGGADSVTVVQNAHQHDLPMAIDGSSNLKVKNVYGTGSSQTLNLLLNPSISSASTAVLLSASKTPTNQAHDNRPAYYELAFIMKL
ncbi:MAG: tail fiber protein [Planctomycetes bacterium]|nr:tail fiber protein [Planctomycetota bacterium]